MIRTPEPFKRGRDADSGIYFMGEVSGNVRKVSALEDIYLWDGEAFVLTEHRLVY